MMRSRCSAFDARRAALRSSTRSSAAACRNRVNSRPSSALLPMISGTAVRRARRASPRPGRAAGSRCRWSGRRRTRRACSVMASLRSAASSAVHQFGRPGGHQRVAASVPAAPEQVGELRRRTRRRRRSCRTMPLAGLSEIAWAKSPSAAGTASSVATACAPALSPKIVTLSGSPPNAAMLSRTQRSAITRSRRNRLPSMVTSARRQRRQVQTAQRAQPVVHRDVDAAAPGQRRTVVDRRGRTADDVAAAVDEDHHRHRFVASPLRARRRSASGSPRPSAGTCRPRERCTCAAAGRSWRTRGSSAHRATAAPAAAPETAADPPAAGRTEWIATGARRRG